jgi:hypothetical protein
VDAPLPADEQMALPQTPGSTLTPVPAAAGNPPLPLDMLYSTYRLTDAELKPKRPQPPRRPFLDGIATFPFRLQNAVPLLKLLSGFWGWLVLIIMLVYCWHLVVQSNGAQALVFGLTLPFLILASVWSGIWIASWAAAYFVTAVEETAAGNDQVDWPKGSWRDWFFILLKLGFVFLFWLTLPYQLLTGLGWHITAYVCFPVSIIIFPFSLLCVMANDRWYVILNRKLLKRLFRRPMVLLGLYAYWLPLGAASLVLGGLNILIACGVALLWSVTLLTLGRVVGRVGWILSQPLGTLRRHSKSKQELSAALPPRSDSNNCWSMFSGRL